MLVVACSQMRLFARASVVLLQHGAAMANFLFARPGTIFVELTPYMLGGSVAERQRLQLLPGVASPLQQLTRQLGAAGLAVHHMAVPVSPAAGRLRSSASAWGPYRGEGLVRIILAERARMRTSRGWVPLG